MGVAGGLGSDGTAERCVCVSPSQHGGLKLPGFSHSGSGLPGNASKQEAEAAPSLRPGAGNRHHDFATLLARGSRGASQSPEKGLRIPPFKGRVTRNVRLSLVCHTVTLGETSPSLANRQGPHDPALDCLLPTFPPSPSSHIGPLPVPQARQGLILTSERHAGGTLCPRYPSPGLSTRASCHDSDLSARVLLALTVPTSRFCQCAPEPLPFRASRLECSGMSTAAF